MMYVGGRGGANGSVWGVRVMNATSRYTNGYVSYFNNGNQAVNYVTGVPLTDVAARTNPFWHLPLGR
jgi:hypothetical protein